MRVLFVETAPPSEGWLSGVSCRQASQPAQVWYGDIHVQRVSPAPPDGALAMPSLRRHAGSRLDGGKREPEAQRRGVMRSAASPIPLYHCSLAGVSQCTSCWVKPAPGAI